MNTIYKGGKGKWGGGVRDREQGSRHEGGGVRRDRKVSEGYEGE